MTLFASAPTEKAWPSKEFVSRATLFVSSPTKKASRATLSGWPPGQKSATAGAFCVARDAFCVIADEESVTCDAFRDEGREKSVTADASCDRLDALADRV
jgi:hypothetical protein